MGRALFFSPPFRVSLRLAQPICLQEECHSVPMKRTNTPLALAGLHLSVLVVVAIIWNRIVPQPYMDEIFHIPQAQRYCKGDYWTWDPKLTTPPGLYDWHSYVISNLLLLARRPFCSAFLLRLTNLIYPILIFFTATSLLQHSHPHLGRNQCARIAAVLLCFPNLWFYNFMYYTDGGSVAFVLLSWLAAKKRHHFLSALASAIAVTFRQTNIIWSLFILGTSLLELSDPSERRRFDPRASSIHSPIDIATSLTGFVSMLFSRVTKVATMIIPHILLLASFLVFVRWNKGIVLGDQSNHVPSMHIAQLFYFVAFSAGMSAFAILGAVPLRHLLKVPSPRACAIILVVLCAMAMAVHKFTFVHPFLLADNRHYTFYLWRIVFGYHWAVRYALAPLYLLAAWACWQAIATEQTILWVLIYATATALTLVPSPLLEFRYFITPYLIYRLSMRQPKGLWILLELAVYTAINAVTVWMFLQKPFRWPHEEGLQRFMW